MSFLSGSVKSLTSGGLLLSMCFGVFWFCHSLIQHLLRLYQLLILLCSQLCMQMLNAMSGAENVLKSYSAYQITQFSNGWILKCMSISCIPLPIWVRVSEYFYLCCVSIPCYYVYEYEPVHLLSNFPQIERDDLSSYNIQEVLNRCYTRWSLHQY